MWKVLSSLCNSASEDLLQQLMLYLLVAACPWIHNHICIPTPSQGELWAWLTAPMQDTLKVHRFCLWVFTSQAPLVLSLLFPASNKCCCTAKQFLCELHKLAKEIQCHCSSSYKLPWDTGCHSSWLCQNGPRQKPLHPTQIHELHEFHHPRTSRKVMVTLATPCISLWIQNTHLKGKWLYQYEKFISSF